MRDEENDGRWVTVDRSQSGVAAAADPAGPSRDLD